MTILRLDAVECDPLKWKHFKQLSTTSIYSTLSLGRLLPSGRVMTSSSWPPRATAPAALAIASMSLSRMAIVALLLVVGCARQEPRMFEASMNFDLENVEPFLARLETRLNLGLLVGYSMISQYPRLEELR